MKKTSSVNQQITPSRPKTNGALRKPTEAHTKDYNSRTFETRMLPRYEVMPQMPAGLPEAHFSGSAEKILKERYLLKGGDLKVVETIAERFWHVAYDVASAEFDFGASKQEVHAQAVKFYKMMVLQQFEPNSPTLMNAGKQNGLQYSACFVLPVDDSLVGIFDSIKAAAIIHKAGGGTGFAFSRLRPNGSMVNTTGGVSSGPVSFLRVFNAATESIKQGGTRRGANMGILRVDHPDVLDFIRCKAELDDMNKPVYEAIAPLLPNDEARQYLKQLMLDRQIANFNISVAITDKFMDAFFKAKNFDLVDPRTKEVVGQLNAKEVFDEIIERAWHTGDPGVVFIDRINHSTANPVPELEEIESTNPCVSGDTWVATKRGWRRADEIVVGDRVATVLGDGEIDHIEVHERKPVFKVTLSDGAQLKVTGAHQFHAIKHGDRAKNAANKRFSQLRLDELEVGDVVRIGQAMMPGNPVSDLPTGWANKDYGFFVGILLGDGCITEKSLSRNVVKVAINSDEVEWTAKVSEVLRKTGSKVVSLNSASGRSANLTVQSSDGAALMVKQSLLMPAYSYQKKIPSEYLNSNQDFLAGLLDGLFSTDGNVNLTTTHPMLRLKTTSYELAQDVRRILLSFGIHGRIATIKRVAEGHIGERVITSRHQQYEVIISGIGVKTFAQQIGLSHPDKLIRLRRAQHEFALTGNTWLARIVSIEPMGFEKVYDLHEPVSDTWLTEGVVSVGCGEQPLAPWDACNLGSINLGKFVSDDGRDLDWEALRQITHASVNFLDNVVQVNPYTLREIYDEVHNNRRIGLGVMGWADMLFKLGTAYNSQEALELGEKVMRFINEEGHRESERLASVRGPFPNWAHSIYKNDQQLRNSTVTTIAPTGTISIIADCSSGIEPVFALAYLHRAKGRGNEVRTLTIANLTFEAIAKKEGFYSDDLATKVMERGTVAGLEEVPEKWQRVFITAQEIEPEWHVKMQAAFQRSTDNGVSKTINMPNSATREDIARAYLMAWETGCNGITVYRDGSKVAQVLNISSSLKPRVEATTGEEVVDEVKPNQSRPMVLRGRTYKIMTPVGEGFVTINRDQNDLPFEVFVTVGKGGMHTTADAEALGRLASLALRTANGNRREVAQKIASQLRGIGGANQIGFGKNRVMSLGDAIGKVLAEELATSESVSDGELIPLNLTVESQPAISNSSTKDDVVQNAAAADSGMLKGADLCPECGIASFVREDGCEKCYSCGYSKC